MRPNRNKQRFPKNMIKHYNLSVNNLNQKKLKNPPKYLIPNYVDKKGLEFTRPSFILEVNNRNVINSLQVTGITHSIVFDYRYTVSNININCASIHIKASCELIIGKRKLSKIIGLNLREPKIKKWERILVHCWRRLDIPIKKFS